jgi:hypothetical protein
MKLPLCQTKPVPSYAPHPVESTPFRSSLYLHLFCALSILALFASGSGR